MSEDKSNAEEKKKTVDLGLLEEDDEFEEFPAEGKSHTVVYVHVVRLGCPPIVLLHNLEFFLLTKLKESTALSSNSGKFLPACVNMM